MATVTPEYVGLALRELGVPLMLPRKRVALSKLLPMLRQTKDTRLLETLPVVLVALERQAPDTDQRVRSYDTEGMTHLFSRREGKDYARWVAFALEVLRATPAFTSAAETSDTMVGNRLPAKQKREGREAFHSKGRELSVFGTRLSAERMQTTLLDYAALQREAERGSLQSRLSLRAQYDLDRALAELFTARQRELLHKRLDGKPFTRSEKVYFYRTVRKRLKALANPDLHRLAADLARK